MSKNAKRTRCKSCGERENLEYEKRGNKIYFFCPNCGSHGEIRFKPNKKTWKN